MLIRIGQFDFTECWDGVLYKNLSNYPEITDWEIIFENQISGKQLISTIPTEQKKTCLIEK